MSTPKLIIFASGEKNSGGTGFQKLVEASRQHILQAEIVAVVSNHEHGGVRQKANLLGIPFIHFPAPWRADDYRRIIETTGAEFTALSGWLKLVTGLDPRTTFNIHPGPLPRFGGPGMFGHHVHEAVLKAHREEGLRFSQVTMHFVTEKYDDGPVFFRLPIPIQKDDSADDIARRVNEGEHKYQARITNRVVNGEITWDGLHPDSLVVPHGYVHHQPVK